MIEVKIDVGNIQIPADIIEKKINALLDEATMTEIHRALAEIIDPWTPYLTGELSKDIAIKPEGVEYRVPYARRKYYGEVYTKDVHPLATSHWDTVAMETQMPVFKARVIEILKERAKQLYG